MKKLRLVSLLAFVLAITAALAFSPPPPTPYGTHTGLGCIAGTIDGTDNCSVQLGSNCSVVVGPSGNQQTVAAFSDGMCGNDNNRLRRTP